ncbi:MAG: hypothetical protein H6719_15995 [Sandaracinaceae bacterium]|nr:hypothetical protein [Sandaracinaceae bacterium]
MTLRATQRSPRRATSACEVHEIRRVRSEPPPRSTDLDLGDPTVSMMVVADPTRVEHVGVFRAPSTDFQIMSADMIEDLRQRLRLAEQREATHGSGIRERPTPKDGLPSALTDAFPDIANDVDDLDELEIDVEPLSTIGEWAQNIGAPSVIEVSLAPHSESNFYGGFDEEYPDGVFVATYQPIPADTPVYAVVHLPGGYRFRTPALVEFVRELEAATPDAPAGVGLRMCGLDGRMRRLIREFAKHRPPLFYIG